jgi:hypothetical protein
MKCKNCGEPIEPGGVWTGMRYSGWAHLRGHHATCIINGQLNQDGLKAEPEEES